MATLNLPLTSPSEAMLEVYLAQPQFGLSEMTTLLELVENALVWGFISAVMRKRDEFEAFGREGLPEVESPREWRQLFDQLDASYREFLLREYAPFGNRVLAGCLLLGSSRTYRFAEGATSEQILGAPDQLYSSILASRAFEGPELAYTDFQKWKHETYGAQLVRLVKVSSGRSIHTVLDLTGFVIVFGLKDYPLYKDSFLLALEMLRRYAAASAIRCRSYGEGGIWGVRGVGRKSEVSAGESQKAGTRSGPQKIVVKTDLHATERLTLMSPQSNSHELRRSGGVQWCC
jgi:hypothetical protein